MKKVLIGILPLSCLILVFSYFIPTQKSDQLNRSKYERLADTQRKSGKPDKPDEAMAHWEGLHETPNEENPIAINWETAERLKVEAAKQNKMDGIYPVSFEEVGPGIFAGRIRALVYKPSNPDHLLAGGVAGGVWKTTDGGKNWRATSDFIETLSVSSMVIDPDQENRVFAGTGEGFFGGGSMRGLGILISDDFGDSWRLLPSTAIPTFYYTNRLVRVPGTSILLAATRAGIQRSTDLGETWTQVETGAGGRGFVDMKMDPSNTSRMYAFRYGQSSQTSGAGNSMLRSTDMGQTWNIIPASSGLPVGGPVGRMEIGIGQDGVVYLSVANPATPHATNGLYRSADGGDTFTKSASTTSFIERQGWYDQAVAVHPTDSNRVTLGAVDVYQTSDGGANINKVTRWNPRAGEIPIYVHADVHAIVYNKANPNIYWVAGDGGVFKTEDGGQSFKDLNNGLNLTQAYGMDVSPDNKTLAIGTQDNGTLFYYGDSQTWLEAAGGDGGFVAWDRQQPDKFYGSFPNGGMFGARLPNFALFNTGFPANTNAPFIQPFAIDPSNGDRMLVGADKLFFTNNLRQGGQSTWTSSSTFGSSVRSVTFSPHNGKIAYAGTTTGALYRFNDLDTDLTFTRISNIFANDVTWIEVDPNVSDDQTLYVTLGDYGANRVFTTTDGGQTWRNIHGNLPNIPYFSIKVDPRKPNRLFLGSELGLWVTELSDAEPVWSRYDFGPAYSRVIQMIWGDQDTLWLATHGRGVYRVTRNPLLVTANGLTQLEGDGDTFLDQREIHEFKLTLKNPTSINFSDVKVTAVADSPGLEILTPAIEPGSFLAGQSLEAAFTFSLASVATPLETVNYRIIIKHPNGEMTYPMSMKVAGNSGNPTAFFDGGEEPTAMTHDAILDVDDWQIVTDQKRSGASAWFSANVDRYADKSLYTPWLTVNDASSEFSFWLYYDMEGDSTQYWDGTALEIQTVGGKFVDIGNTNTGLPYDGLLFRNSALYTKPAWSGTQRTWREGKVSLGAYLGQKVRLRFRVACDTATANPGGGVWIDDINASGVTWPGLPNDDAAECSSCSRTRGGDPMQSYYLARTPASGDIMTHVGVVNPSDQPVTVTLTGFAEDGRVRSVQNKTLAANGRLWAPLNQVFPYNSEQVNWVQVTAASELHVFGEVQGPGSRSAYRAASGLRNSVFMPHVAKNTALFATYIAAINGDAVNGQSQLASSESGSSPVSLANQHQPYQRLQNTALNYFNGDISQVDWATLSSDRQNLAAMEYFTRLPDESQVASLGLDERKGTTVRFLHIASDLGNFWTGMVYINTAAVAAQINETYYGADGSVLDTRSYQLAANAKTTLLLDTANVGNPVPQGAAWLEVQSDQDLIGYELFGSPLTSATDRFVGLQGSYDSGTELVYQHIEAGDNRWTGIVALNLGDTAADISFSLYDKDGQVLETANRTAVAPKTKIVLLASDLFSAEALAQGEWARGQADAGSSWAGFLLWGDLSGGQSIHMSGMTANVE